MTASSDLSDRLASRQVGADLAPTATHCARRRHQARGSRRTMDAPRRRASSDRRACGGGARSGGVAARAPEKTARAAPRPRRPRLSRRCPRTRTARRFDARAPQRFPDDAPPSARLPRTSRGCKALATPRLLSSSGDTKLWDGLLLRYHCLSATIASDGVRGVYRGFGVALGAVRARAPLELGVGARWRRFPRSDVMINDERTTGCRGGGRRGAMTGE